MNTACTPGSASAAVVSMPLIVARANGLRTKHACNIPGRCDVVDEGALAGQQAGVLDPRDPGACVAGGDGVLGGRGGSCHLA